MIMLASASFITKILLEDPAYRENIRDFSIRPFYWFVLQKVTSMDAKLPDTYLIYINSLQISLLYLGDQTKVPTSMGKARVPEWVSMTLTGSMLIIIQEKSS